MLSKPAAHPCFTRFTLRAAAVAALCLFALPAHAACHPQRFVVAVDVGHTPEQPGAISARGITEFAFNLALARTVSTTLLDHGFAVKPIIVTGAGKSQLAARVEKANAMAPDLLVSIHHDSVQPHYLERWDVGGRRLSYSDRFEGFSLFVSKANTDYRRSLRFATLIADELLGKGLSFTTHHAEKIKGENRKFADAKRGIYEFPGLRVLRDTQAPAVLLEAGIIVNRQEEVELASPDRRKLVADAVTKAVRAMCEEKASDSLALR